MEVMNGSNTGAIQWIAPVFMDRSLQLQIEV
jgi:hypothetical protein